MMLRSSAMVGSSTRRALALLTTPLWLGCGSGWLSAPPSEDTGDTVVPLDSSDGGRDTGDGTDHASVTHEFGDGVLPPFGETEPCVSWTLHNEQPLYVQAVTLSNLSSFHHSNWFVVPDDVYEGDDGYWDCGSRGFEEIAAAQAGTVLFAQSTQTWTETQRTAAGAVIKIPAHSRIVGGVHLLNLSPRELATNLWLTLDLIHPREVDAVLTPMRLSYLDLDIPASSRVRNSGACDFRSYLAGNDPSLWDRLKIHYALPHYHGLGDYFDLRVFGGENDGQTLYQLEGFDAEANGRTYDPPLELEGSDGLAFTCGYDNFRSEDVGWGVGDQEMCVMLLLVESDMLLDGSVISGSHFVGTEDDIKHFEGSCFVIGYPRSGSQGPPTPAELAAPLYVPPVDDDDAGLPPVPVCHDVDRSAAPLPEPTLATIRQTLFAPACSFSGCHGLAAAGGLDLTRNDLHDALLGHSVTAKTSLPLVAPGDPDGSWLYRLLAECEPTNDAGAIVAHMPRNAPVLLDDAVIATVRAWIDAGAPP